MNTNTLPDTSLKGAPKRRRRTVSIADQITLSSNKSSAMIREEQELLQSLDHLSLDPEERELQRQTYTAIRESLRRGENGGIIKLPTGTGKTWVFANLLKIFRRNGLILVPRTDLYSSTIRDLKEAGFQDSEIRLISEESGANSEERMLSVLTDPSIDWSSGRNVTIMTYQSLNSMFKKNPEIGSFMRSHFDMIIEDEAHRALGKKTKKAVNTLTEDGETTVNLQDSAISLEEDTIKLDTIEQDLTEQNELQQELEAEVFVEHILGLDDENFKSDNRFNYKFTATPDLLGKSVSDENEYIFYATFEQAVRTRAIILPQYIDMGSAYLRSGNLEKWKVKDIELLSDSESDEFIDENGLSIRDKIIDAYIEKKQQHNNSLPAVAFASTIKHAGILVDAMRAKGIKAARVTSAKGDISSQKAIEMMDQGQLDIIVTVTKVSEGFDYAPLSCALWFAPVTSPAKITQGNGRISRITPEKMPEQIEDEQGRITPSPSTYIIAPSEWYSGSRVTNEREDAIDGLDGTDIDEIDTDDNKGDDDMNPLDYEDGMEDQESDQNEDIGNIPRKKLSRIGNFYELLVSQGEFDYNTIPTQFQNIISFKDSIICEVGEEKDIDGVVYVGVVSTIQEIMGLRGYFIISSAKKDPDINILQGRQKSGLSIQLVPKMFIKLIQKNKQYKCEVGNEIQIDELVYVGVVSQAQDIMGLKGQTILANVRKDPNITILQGRQKSGKSIQLIPKSFIEPLLDTCEPGEEKLINGVLHVGIIVAQEIVGLTGGIILRNARKDPNITILQGRQKSGKSIQLIPKSFIESLLDTCKPGEERLIDGVLHVGMANKQEVMGLKSSTIIGCASKDSSIVIKKGKRRSGQFIQMIPKTFIESLLDTCEVGEEKEIDGVIYIGVIGKQEVMGLKGQTILNNAKKDLTLMILQGRQKNGSTIQLVPKGFIESLAAKKTKK